MQVRPTALDGVVEITPRRFVDDRGWFSEVWNNQVFVEAGFTLDWVQDNESFSATTGTIRGIHFQTEPKAQDKLIRVIRGRIFDVAVDLRRGSPTFGGWVGRELSAETGNQLLVPKGFGHAFMTLTTDCLVSYKVTAHHDAAHDRAIAWNDPTIAIAWPSDTTPTLSDRDANAPTLEDSTELFDSFQR